MHFKVATVNIKKSYKDYTIYFLTLILGVCVFYSFNAIDSQRALIDMKSSNINLIDKLTDIMSIVSVLVSIILGFLMLYANNFLIKKRKKELGIYMILGMSKGKISLILVLETFIVGASSLMMGLLLGIGTSQALAAFSLRLFDIGIDEYMFAVSINAIGKTIVYFGIMFLLVMVFNVFVISRYEIIDLLTIGRKNETIRFKKPLVYLLLFTLAVVLLGFSYTSILKIGLDFRDPMFKVSVISLVIGTVTFFLSVSGIILYIINKNKKLYFKGLNIFLLKQISSKVNTNFISMSVICLMLFITILVLSTGVNAKKESEARIHKETPFDASIIMVNNGQDENLQDVLNKNNFKVSKDEKSIYYNEYTLDTRVSDILLTENNAHNDVTVLSFVKISDYNKMLKLKGEKETSLNKNEVLLISNNNTLIKSFNKKLKAGEKVNVKGKKYIVKDDKVLQGNLVTSYKPFQSLTVVINDNLLSDSEIYRSVLSVMYTDDNREEHNKKYIEVHRNLHAGSVYVYAKDSMYSLYKKSTTTILFVAIYLGMVFLITSTAVLAIKQLSEASESIEKYRALKRIGATKTMINKVVFNQVLIYFALPVILALVHSVVGILVVNKDLSAFNQMDIRVPALITALIFGVVYYVYFYTTYLAYKNIVKNNI